jgi:hypothetical protein
MLDPINITEGVIAGVTTHAVTKQLEPSPNVSNPPDFKAVSPATAEGYLQLLQDIKNALSPQEQTNIDHPLALQPYPYEYVVNENWHNKAHFCIFFQTSTPIRFDIEGVGTYLKTVGPGWIQCDVRGRISTTDATNHTVIISYRVDAIGASL